jgi:biopolymer transport protein ExbB/TolQ
MFRNSTMKLSKRTASRSTSCEKRLYATTAGIAANRPIAVAVPAVLAYNLFGKWVAACEAELEGFAHDLREIMAPQAD